MIEPLAIAAGQQLSLEYPVVDWSPQFVDAMKTTIKLTAYIQVGPNPPISLNLGPKATTLEVQMDAQVAMTLYAKLRVLAQNMGWLREE